MTRYVLPFLILTVGCAGGSSVVDTKAKQLGISVYPGAVESTTGDKTAGKAGPDEKNVRLFLDAKDPVAKVADYYAKETGIKAVSEGKGFSIMGKSAKGAFLIMGFEPDGTGTKITAMGLVSKDGS